MSNNTASSKANYKGNWETPWPHFELIRESFSFWIDVCADEHNTKSDLWIDEEQDALKETWRVDEGYHWWCNPPFNKAAEFLAKAHYEMLRGHPGIMLLPGNFEAKWFREGVTERGIRILFYPQRIQFKDPLPPPPPLPGEKKKRSGNTKGSILAAFSMAETLPRVAGQPWWGVV